MFLFLIRNSSSQSGPSTHSTIYSCCLLSYSSPLAIHKVCLTFIARINFSLSYLEQDALISHFVFATAHIVLVTYGLVGILLSEARSIVLFCTLIKLLTIFLKKLINTRFFSPMLSIFI